MWDARHGITGELPDGDDAESVLYRSQFRSLNLRKEEGMVLANETCSDLLKSRTLLARGKTTEAEDLLYKIVDSSKDPVDLVEAKMEVARSKMFKGQWQEAMQITEYCLQSDPPPVSKLALFQMLALCLFELGHFLESRTVLEKALALAEIYPQSTSRIYSNTLSVKLAARLQSIEAAKLGLKQLWVQFRESLFKNPDTLSVLLRLEGDLLRLEQKDYGRFVVASYLYEKLSGDQVYQALALVDLIPFVDKADREVLEKELGLASQQLPRIQTLVAELQNREISPSTTAQDILNYQARDVEVVRMTDLSQQIQFYFHRQEQLLIRHDSQEVIDLSGKQKLVQFLNTLSIKPTPKVELFKRIWGSQKYVPHLHNGLIRALVHRARKELGVQVETSEEGLALNGVLAL